MVRKPNPNTPITHINPPTQVPDRLPPQKPGTFDPKLPQDTEANPDRPKKKPR